MLHFAHHPFHCESQREGRTRNGTALYNLTLSTPSLCVHFAHCTFCCIHNLTLCTLSLRIEYYTLLTLLFTILHCKYTSLWPTEPLLPLNCLWHNYQCCFCNSSYAVQAFAPRTHCGEDIAVILLW